MVAFINTFLSYIVLMAIILVVAALGFIVGRFLRKRKNAKLAGIADDAEIVQVAEIDYSETQENK